MFRLFVWLTLIVTIGCSLAVGAIRLPSESTTLPGQETLAHFDCTPKPCWHGIHLGVTSIRDAASILDADRLIGFIDFRTNGDSLCWNWQKNPSRENTGWDGCYINNAGFEYALNVHYDNSPMHLGDLIPLIGRPTGSILCAGSHVGVISSGSTAIYVSVPNNQPTIDPEATVLSIYYQHSRTDTLPLNPNLPLSWWRFASIWKSTSTYCGN